MDLTSIGTLILAPIFKIIDKAIPDKTKAMELKAEIEKMTLENKAQMNATLKEIAVAEIQGNWFQSSWRPLLSYSVILLFVWVGFLKGVVTAITGVEINSIDMSDLLTFGTVWASVYGLGRTFEKSGSSVSFKRE